jgi:uncharacterized membrane protein YcaP (DUF421 family)
VDLFTFTESPQVLVLRSAAIYLVMLAGLRLFGKREVGQFTLFDLVVILLIANAVQPAMTGPDTSLGAGFVIIASLLSLNLIVSRLRIRFLVVERLLEPRPVIVGRDGRWLHDVLKHEGVTDEECMATLREHGVASIAETALVVLEADGSLSVVPKDRELHRGRRRKVRFIQRG